MARAKVTSSTTVGQGIKLVLLSLVFVAAQIMVGYHHVGEEYGHTHSHAHAHDHNHAHPLAQILADAHDHADEHGHDSDHSDLSAACDICTIAATVSGSRDVSFIPEAPLLRNIELPIDADNLAAVSVARPGGPRAPPQTL